MTHELPPDPEGAAGCRPSPTVGTLCATVFQCTFGVDTKREKPILPRSPDTARRHARHSAAAHRPQPL